MKNQQITSKKQDGHISMMVDGHPVTCTFAKEHNPSLSALIRNTLLDSYIKRVGLGVDDAPVDAYSILSGRVACQ